MLKLIMQLVCNVIPKCLFRVTLCLCGVQVVTKVAPFYDNKRY